MKTVQTSFGQNLLLRKAGAYLAAAAAVGILALAGSALRASAHEGHEPEHFAHGLTILENAQVAELDQLAADFHGALSYGGDIDAMMRLWVENPSVTLNGTAYVGKDAVTGFFTSSGYFHNNWVSLAPEYKTEITLHGDQADLSTQCVAVDLTVTPNVVRAVIQVNAKAVKRHGKWFFLSMNNTSPAPL